MKSIHKSALLLYDVRLAMHIPHSLIYSSNPKIFLATYTPLADA